MAEQRLVLVIGSQCQALGPLSFLPEGQGPAQLERLRREQRLVVRLRDLLVDGPGGCAPVRVGGESAPGLLVNPTKEVADAALIAALEQAHTHEAVLVVHFLGHGTRYEADRDRPARRQHLLHVWDTVADPKDTEPESNGWDPYQLVERRRAYTAGHGRSGAPSRRLLRVVGETAGGQLERGRRWAAVSVVGRLRGRAGLGRLLH